MQVQAPPQENPSPLCSFLDADDDLFSFERVSNAIINNLSVSCGIVACDEDIE